MGLHMNQFEVLDSGVRRESETGAVRDRAVGKGRYDLLNPIAVNMLAEFMSYYEITSTDDYNLLISSALGEIHNITWGGVLPDIHSVISALVCIMLAMDAKNDIEKYESLQKRISNRSLSIEGKRYDLIPPHGLHRIACVFEKGALKYSERNWEKGMPLSWFVDSALRHLYQHLDGNIQEDHIAHAACNLFMFITIKMKINAGNLPEYFNDLPNNGVKNESNT